jgi:dihydrofolate reductase
MPTQSVFIARSLDGYIARKDGALDWLPEEPEDHGYTEFMASVDAYVMGRGTYDTVLGFGAWPLGKTPVFVATSRPLPEPLPEGSRVEPVSGDPAAIVAALAARGIERLYVDGGKTIQQFLRVGLIQRLIITTIPVLLGGGIPLFGALPADVKLRHVHTRSFPSGLVQSEYAISP